MRLGGEDDEFGRRNGGGKGKVHGQESQGRQGKGQDLCWWRLNMLVLVTEEEREVGANCEEV